MSTHDAISCTHDLAQVAHGHPGTTHGNHAAKHGRDELLGSNPLDYAERSTTPRLLSLSSNRGSVGPQRRCTIRQTGYLYVAQVLALLHTRNTTTAPSCRVCPCFPRLIPRCFLDGKGGLTPVISFPFSAQNQDIVRAFLTAHRATLLTDPCLATSSMFTADGGFSTNAGVSLGVPQALQETLSHAQYHHGSCTQ